MAQVITFVGYRPIARYDELPWTHVRIEEAATEDGTYVEIDDLVLDPVDADPSDPASRNLTTELASDDADLWYRLVFIDASGDESVATSPIQNATTITGFSSTPYATVAELARLLKVDAATYEDQLTEVLRAAAGEIDSELGRDGQVTEQWELALCAQVNLERAEEHWKQRALSFGIIGLDVDSPIRVARDTWDRHAHKLAPLKSSWGLA